MYGHPGMRSVALPVRAFLGLDRLRALLAPGGRYAYRRLRFAVADGHGGYVRAT